MHTTLEPWKTLSKAFLGRTVKSDMVMSSVFRKKRVWVMGPSFSSVMYFSRSLSIPSVVPFLESARLPSNPGVSRKVMDSPSASGILYSTISGVGSSSVCSPGVPLTASQTALMNVVLPLSAFPITAIVGPCLSFDIVQRRVDSQWRRCKKLIGQPILVTWCAG
ncbi:hypothetical protein DFP72DRAFT_918194 [Ephemerocybe angulata]|uniref:Uncharacterized protein n=1 Tax=Ephemerocybe angulata TaxID=980116 RepID=A0A8H6M180_9AGAR|nr:hypothetical protein DFP72DRAFT_918194 [Tulosesus angulatus]